MRRDMDLVRKLLLKYEEISDGEKLIIVNKIEINDYSKEQIAYHTYLLWEAGFINAHFMGSKQSVGNIGPIGLTWQGHEFLEASRDDTIWRKAKSYTLEKVGTLTLEGIKAALQVIIKDQITGGL